jgi:hypothetical protein
LEFYEAKVTWRRSNWPKTAIWKRVRAGNEVLLIFDWRKTKVFSIFRLQLITLASAAFWGQATEDHMAQEDSALPDCLVAFEPEIARRPIAHPRRRAVRR